MNKQEADRIERLAALGRQFQDSGNWEAIVIDGTRSRPVLRISGNKTMVSRNQFSYKARSLSGSDRI